MGQIRKRLNRTRPSHTDSASDNAEHHDGMADFAYRQSIGTGHDFRRAKCGGGGAQASVIGGRCSTIAAYIHDVVDWNHHKMVYAISISDVSKCRLKNQAIFITMRTRPEHRSVSGGDDVGLVVRLRAKYIQPIGHDGRPFSLWLSSRSLIFAALPGAENPDSDKIAPKLASVGRPQNP